MKVEGKMARLNDSACMVPCNMVKWGVPIDLLSRPRFPPPLTFWTMRSHPQVFTPEYTRPNVKG